MANIRYIKRADLDVERWNACIDKAPNGLIYAYTFYLDVMSDNWCALVMNDYEAVMPLPYRKKWGITYVHVPPFIQQLGVFSSLETTALTPLFLAKAEEAFRFGDYFINYANADFNKKHTNFILPLNTNYLQIYKGFKTDLKNNLKRAQPFNLHYQATNDYEKAITLYRQLYQPKMQNIKAQGYERFTTLCNLLQQKEMICIRKVTDADNNLLAIALCTKDKNRLYLIACSTTAEGRKKKATHFLLDRMIHEFCNGNYTFDFEGSDLPGVRAFYSNFGGVDQPYFFHHWNRLPWPIKLLK